MYVRRIDGEETTFGVSGTLWRDALVFYDRKTETYWSQITGTAIHGPHTGRHLDELPSVVTTWGEWKTLHPETLVQRPDAASRDGSGYARYFDDPDRFGVMGHANPDKRLPGKSLVLGIHGIDASTAVPLDLLSARKVVQGVVGSTPLVAFSAGGQAAVAFDRRVDGKTLDFETDAAGRIVDTQTSSVWDPETGKALAGPMKGHSLPRLKAMRAYWFIWARFNPKTAIIKP